MRGRFLVLLLSATTALAQSSEGVVEVPTPTGTDAASVARRVQLLEDRLSVLWSVRQGPDVLALDTVDRLATRLLALEARLATVEEATGVREARTSHGHGEGAFDVALAVLLLDRADWSTRPAASTAADAGDAGEQWRLQQLMRAAPWPQGLQAKARQLDEAWSAWAQAAARGDAPGLAQQASELQVIRRDLRLAASNWVASMLAAGGAGHDHSGKSAGAHADHSPHHGGQVSMKGDIHVEVVSEAAGKWRVYLSDAFRQPLPVTGWTGELVLFPDSDDERAVALAEMGAALGADTAAGGRSPVDVRARLTVPDGMQGRLGPAAATSGERAFEIDFQFMAEGPGGTGDPVPVHPPDCPMAPKEQKEPAPVRPQTRSRRWR